MNAITQTNDPTMDEDGPEPPPIVTAYDVSEAVRSTAMLAEVNISMWSGERTDPGLMEQIKADAGAVGNVGKVVKNMLAGADQELKDARTAYAAVRSKHYALTLPWISDPHAQRATGPRLLPNALFETYLGEMAKLKRAALQQLDAFILGYPNAIAQAKVNLAALADLNYPSADEVRAMFRVNFDFEPVPSGAAFTGLPSATLDKLSTALSNKQGRMLAAASLAMWEEASARLGRLANSKTRIHTSTVESARELVTLLPAWNIAGDPRVSEITQDISRMLGNTTAEAFRKDDKLWADVQAQAGDIMTKITSWFM